MTRFPAPATARPSCRLRSEHRRCGDPLRGCLSDRIRGPLRGTKTAANQLIRLPGWKTLWYPLRHMLFFPLPERLRPWIEAELALVAQKRAGNE